MKKKNNSAEIYRLALSGLLVALMLVLGYLESLLPSVGVPGIRLGLSNSVLVFAVYLLGLPNAMILMALKVVLSGLLFSGVTAMIYAFAGGLLSLTVMMILSRFSKIPISVVSMAGGLVHNIGQMAVAMVVLHTPKQIMAYFAVLCVAGVVCGFLTGVAAKGVMAYLSHTVMKKYVPEHNRMKDAILIAVAIVITAAGVGFAITRFVKSTPTATVVSTQENVPAMLSLDEIQIESSPEP